MFYGSTEAGNVMTATIPSGQFGPAQQNYGNTVKSPTLGAYFFDFGFTDPHDTPANRLWAVEITTLPHLGLAKFTHEDFVPIARLNADPAAITVRADAPWNTVEEFLAAARKAPNPLSMGNAGNGSIWHLAAASLEDRTGITFNHIPFPGANPAVLALMGGHVDAVAVSPAEVSVFVQSGKLKTLANRVGRPWLNAALTVKSSKLRAGRPLESRWTSCVAPVSPSAERIARSSLTAASLTSVLCATLRLKLRVQFISRLRALRRSFQTDSRAKIPLDNTTQ